MRTLHPDYDQTGLSLSGKTEVVKEMHFLNIILLICLSYHDKAINECTQSTCFFLRTMEDIQHSEKPSGGSFFISASGTKVGELNYRNTDKREIIIDHTSVSSDMEGKGVGKALVQAAVHWARVHHKKVVPQCSFAKAVIEKDNSLQDVLHE